MSAIDSAVLEALAAATGSRAFVIDILEKYVRVTDEMLGQLRAAVDTADHAAASSLAHSLKSSSRTVGATQLGTLLEDLERAASDQRPLAELMERVCQEFERVREAAREPPLA